MNFRTQYQGNGIIKERLLKETDYSEEETREGKRWKRKAEKQGKEGKQNGDDEVDVWETDKMGEQQ